MHAQSARLVGKVAEPDKTAIEGAEVVLRAHGWLFSPEFGEIHELRCESGKNGRFRAKLFADRRYSAWARLPGEPARFTKIAEDVVAGKPVTLQAESFERRALKLKVLGLDAWKEHGPFRFRVTDAARNFTSRMLEAQENGELHLPQLAGSKCFLEILDAKGEILIQQSFGYAKTKAPAPATKPRPAIRFQVPPPLTLRIRAVRFENPDKGPDKGIEGAKFAWILRSTHRTTGWAMMRDRERELLRPLGSTDKTGRLTSSLPIDPKRLWHSLVARAPGRVLTAAPLNTYKGSSSFTTIKKAEDGTLEILLRMKQGRELKGRVVDASGKAVAGLRLAYPQPAAVWFEENSSSWRTRPDRIVETDADGSFHFGAIMRLARATITALPNAEQRMRLMPEIDEATRAARAIQLTTHEIQDKPGLEDLGALKPKLRALPVGFKSEQGPVRYAQIALLHDKHGIHDRTLDRTQSDRRGRAMLFAPKHACILLVWDQQLGYLIRKIPANAVAADLENLELTPYRWAQGSVTNHRGEAVPFASINTAGTMTRGASRFFVRQINDSLRIRRADRDGKIRFPFIPEPNWSATLLANTRIGRNAYQSERVELHARDEDQEGLSFVIDTQRGDGKKKKKKKPGAKKN